MLAGRLCRLSAVQGELDVLEADPAARVARAVVELHRHLGRRRPMDVRVPHVADLHGRALHRARKQNRILSRAIYTSHACELLDRNVLVYMHVCAARAREPDGGSPRRHRGWGSSSGR